MKTRLFALFLPAFLLFSCASTKGLQEELIVSEKSNFVCRYNLPKDYSKAETYRTGSPDKNIVNFVNQNDELRTKDTDEYVNSLCRLIRVNAKNDFEKAKMVHDFAAYLLPYDYLSLNGNRKWQDWRAVIRNKTGVCEGYARVFKEICTRVGLKAVYVNGYAGRMGSDTYHAWNIVQCEKEWYLVDPTWDTYVDSKYGNNVVHTSYLFLNPEQFILTHYPTGYETESGTFVGTSAIPDYHLQLLSNPLSIAEHSKLLSIRKKEATTYNTFDSVFAEFYSSIKSDVYIGNELTLNYKLNPDQHIWVTIYEKNSDKIFKNNFASVANFYKVLNIPKGTYTAIVYGGNTKEKTGNALIKFTIHAGAPESKWNVSPTGGIHQKIDFGTRPTLADYTNTDSDTDTVAYSDSETETDENLASVPDAETEASKLNISLTGTVHEFDLSSAVKNLSFVKNPYSPNNNPTITADISIISILKTKNVKQGDIIRFKGKLETTDSLNNLTVVFYDPDPSKGYWKEVTQEKTIVKSAGEVDTIEFSQDFVVIYKPRTDLKIQFSLRMLENYNMSKTLINVIK